MHTQKHFIEANNRFIPAVITYPSIAAPCPSIIMLHGTASDKNEVNDGYVRFAAHAAQQGILTVRFDFIGSGESNVDSARYSFQTALEDIEAVLVFMQTLPQADITRIGLLGWSQGGTLALLAASQHKEVGSVVTWAGAAHLDSMIEKQDYQAAQKNGYAIHSFAWRSDFHVSLQWLEDVMAFRIASIAADIEAPIMAIHGKQDDVVSYNDAYEIVSAAKHPQSHVLLMENTDHIFSIFSDNTTAFADICTKTTDWFLQTL